jgi:hypothetical protein
MRNVSEVVEEIKTHLMFFFNPVIYEIMWKNIEEPGGPQVTCTWALNAG